LRFLPIKTSLIVTRFERCPPCLFLRHRPESQARRGIRALGHFFLCCVGCDHIFLFTGIRMPRPTVGFAVVISEKPTSTNGQEWKNTHLWARPLPVFR
jgi:hypothetical protein